jgi:hypothetical protein
MLSLHGGLNSPSIDVLLRYHRFPENFKPSADASWRKLTQLEYYTLRVGPSRRRYMFGRRTAFGACSIYNVLPIDLLLTGNVPYMDVSCSRESKSRKCYQMFAVFMRALCQ